MLPLRYYHTARTDIRIALSEGDTPRGGEHGALHRMRFNVPECSGHQESMVGRGGLNTRARQMTQLPGEKKQNDFATQPEDVPEGTNEQESLLGQPKDNTRTGQNTQLPGERDEKV